MRLRLIIAATLIAILIAGAGCGTSSSNEEKDPFLLSLAEEVDTERMMKTIDYLASDELRGRPTGSPQMEELQGNLEERFVELGLEPVVQLGLEGYRQEFEVPANRCSLEEPPPGEAVTGVNILGMIPGESESELVFIIANYDGLGVDASTGNIYRGADFNASGASAVLEIAGIFASLDRKPRKTLVFALLDAEECGGFGSAALAEKLESSELKSDALIINLEGLGAGEGDYMDIWDLNYRKNRPTVDATEEAASLLDVDLELGGADPGTSAGTFFLYHLPAVTIDWSWFDRDEHPDFHLPSDTPNRINREGLRKATQVVTVATWLLAEN